ncbi:hypothetical protein V8G54_021349 [Vigna mungo]|uniref:Kinesin motor domain-containing protein n=1 Tax=Vigna mungo TaxID=3915 RepID=A0AAQ3NH69_VIGMU
MPLIALLPLTINTLEIQSSSQKGLSVPDASLVPLSSTIDVIELMNLGQRNRAVGATALNDRSSRSHRYANNCIFPKYQFGNCLTIHVQGSDLTSAAILRGCMHLVDLAGSERRHNIFNKSLSALGDVIAPFLRETRMYLTETKHNWFEFSDNFGLIVSGGQAKTLMFVHISSESDAIGETISTLNIAERVATVELDGARVNKDSSDIKELKKQLDGQL